MPEIKINKNDKKPKNTRKFKRILSLLLIILIVFLLWQLLKKDTTMQPATSSDPSNQQNSIDALNKNENVVATKLKTFSGAEFVDLYNKFAYPNVREFEITPPITGNAAADERIRTIAIERGYIGRSVAVPPLENVGNYKLQTRAANAWRELVEAGKKDSQKLSLTAAFRTIEEQRDLFNEALSAAGASSSSIASGKSDSAVNNVLKRVSIPGYTRHHSGYAVDIACDNDLGVVFGASACYRWLSRNNYENAKKYGWIPSYPSGAPKQGPVPEEWEYCWVGYDALSEPIN